MSLYPHTTLAGRSHHCPRFTKNFLWGRAGGVSQQGKKNPLQHRLLPALRKLTPRGGHAAPPPSDWRGQVLSCSRQPQDPGGLHRQLGRCEVPGPEATCACRVTPEGMASNSSAGKMALLLPLGQAIPAQGIPGARHSGPDHYIQETENFKTVPSALLTGKLFKNVLTIQ